MNGSKEMQMDESELALVHTYSRASAIKNGLLIDVGNVAMAGILYRVALTYDVWARYVEFPKHVKGQDEAERLGEILWATRLAVRTSPRDSSSVPVFLSVRNDNASPVRVLLRSVVDAGDCGEPVITIMLPHEL